MKEIDCEGNENKGTWWGARGLIIGLARAL